MRTLMFLVLAIVIAGCASTVDPTITSARENAAMEKVLEVNRSFRSCAKSNAEQWIDSNEPASVVADLAIDKCSSLRGDLQFYIHEYNRVFWDPEGRGGPLLSMAYEATQKNIRQLTDQAKNSVMEFVIEERIKRGQEQ